MYQLRLPFDQVLNDVSAILALSDEQLDNLIEDMTTHCEMLKGRLRDNRIELRPNKLHIHCIDVDYIFPPNYRFVDECCNFVRCGGMIVFDHLENFEIIRRLLERPKQNLSMCSHPITGDTLWHLNPFVIDLMQAEISNVYNFRGETPNERRLLADLLRLPQVGRFPVDITNIWDMTTLVYVDSGCDMSRDPLALCRYIKRGTANVA